MPTNRRRRQVRRLTHWTDSHRGQLRHGHDFFGHGFGDICKVPMDQRANWPPPHIREQMFEAWEIFGDELMGEAIHKGCQRPWFWWHFIALPESPLLRMVDDTDVPPTSTHDPSDRAWEGRFYEPAFMYLVRTGHLQDGEVERCRAGDTIPGIEHTLNYYRTQARYNNTAHRHDREPWELACVHVIYDPDGKRDLLTGDELRLAASYIRKLTEAAS